MGNVVRPDFRSRKSNKIVDKKTLQKELQKKKKIKFSPRKLIIVILIFYLTFAFGKGFYQIVKLDKEIEKQELIKAELLEENKKLKAEIKKLNSEAYIEREARRRLGLVKPGETIMLPSKPGNPIKYNEPKAGEILH